MRRALVIHPASACTAVKRIDVQAVRPRPGALALHYIVSGIIGGLRLPAMAASTRADELWKRTCFEAFVRQPANDAYCEFNFSPSTQWAAYGFSSYRQGMRPLGDVSAPHLEVRSDAERFEMRVSLDLTHAPLPGDADWRLALTAVIEETNGQISYWSLSHPPGKPDFHHPDCFAYDLPAAENS